MLMRCNDVATLAHTITSADTDYDGLLNADGTIINLVTVTDNDTIGLTLTGDCPDGGRKALPPTPIAWFSKLQAG